MHGAKEYTVTFLLISAGATALAVALGGAAWALLWVAAAFLIVASAYLGLGPRLLGKRGDGTIASPARLLLGPYFLATWALWRLHPHLVPDNPCAEVAPGLWLGRRPRKEELPEGVSLLVDLTAEFTEPRGLVAKVRYRCLPTLDADAPARGPLLALVEEIAAFSGGVYVHCANGRGRSALVVAAVLLARGLAGDVEQALALVRKARPNIDLSKSQRRLLERVSRALIASARSLRSATSRSPRPGG
jgi:protein-tyrosine phosphatase